MSKTPMRKPLAIAIGAALATTFGAVTVANADASPFAMTALGSGYMAADAGEGKCGEGKCGGGKGGKGGDMFASMDKDSDGEITQAEHAAYWDGRFNEWDENKDAQITESEMEAAMKARHKGKGAEGSCGGDKGAEGSCGGDKGAEGSCGGDKGAEGSCGGDKGAEGSCGGDKGERMQKMSEDMDTNEDAAVDRTEFTAYWDAKFRSVDADDDGSVTEEEMQAEHEKMRSGMHDSDDMDDMDDMDDDMDTMDDMDDDMDDMDDQ